MNRQPPPGHFGWRYWALNPYGHLVSPYVGALAGYGTLQAPCVKCGDGAPASDCGCGICFVPYPGNLFDGQRLHFMQPDQHFGITFSATLERCPWVWRQIRDGSVPFALTFGVAVGDVEIDKAPRVLVYRARRWHILAMLLGKPVSAVGSKALPVASTIPVRGGGWEWGDAPQMLAKQFGCEVHTGTSRNTCDAIAERLVESVSGGAIAELASRHAAALVRPRDFKSMCDNLFDPFRTGPASNLLPRLF